MGKPKIETLLSSQHLALVKRWVADGIEPVELGAKLEELGYKCTRPTAHRLIRDHKPTSLPPPPTPAVPPATDVHRTTRRAVRALEATDGAPEIKAWARAYLNRWAERLDAIVDAPGETTANKVKAISLGLDIMSQMEGLAEVMSDD